jgi:hypothetical protein
VGFVVCLVAAENLRDILIGDSIYDDGVFLIHDYSPFEWAKLPELPQESGGQFSGRGRLAGKAPMQNAWG